MIRLFIQKDSKWQEVESDIDISLVINSEFLGASQSGSFSFSVVCPLTAKNRIVFQGLENPQLVANRRIEYPAQLLIGSESYENWYFVLREVSAKSYRFDLIKTPGNQPRNFYERKLHQLDFGKLPIDITSKKSGIWAIDLFPSDTTKTFRGTYYTNNLYPEIEGSNIAGSKMVYFEIWVNGAKVCSSPNTGNIKQNNYYNNYYNGKGMDLQVTDPYDRINATLTTFNATNTDYNVVINNPNAAKGTFNIVMLKPDFVITSAVVKTYQWSFGFLINAGGDINIIKANTPIKEYEFIELNYNDITDGINEIQDDIGPKPFRFITYFNDSFYPSDNADYEGIVNQYSSTNRLKLNSIVQKTSYPISPCFSLKFIITKIAEMMGYTLVSSLFDDDSLPQYLGEIYLINNVDLAQQLSGTTIPYNVYANEINYADFMPDMSVKEFIDALRTTFALYVDYQFDTSKMVIEKMKSLLESTEVVDISDNVSPFPRADITDKKYFQLSFREADENIKLVRNYPADAITTASSLNYQKIEAGFSPVLNSKDLDEFLATDPNPGIPTVEESARTPLYLDQQNNRPAQRLCLVNALALPDANGRVATSADNKNENMVLSWTNHADGQKGLLETCYQEYLDFLDNTVQWTTEVALTDSQIIKFSFGKKYMAYGTLFLAETLTTKLPIRKESQLKLLSL